MMSLEMELVGFGYSYSLSCWLQGISCHHSAAEAHQAKDTQI